MRTLAVIPARGGSKGIPRKNMRLMGGRPLISYAIENALACPLVGDVAVTSESDEILAFAAQYEGVWSLERKSALAADAVTLDPVVFDAVEQMEALRGRRYDAVVTLQPTSPLLTPEVLGAALEEFEASGKDSLISVVNAPHLSWRDAPAGGVEPAYEERLNRQQLPASYLETGAFLIAKRACVTPETRLGVDVGVFEVPEAQATDIDTRADWVVCEAMLSRKRVAFRVDGYRELGLGHVYRALTLAYALTEHDVVFLCDPAHPLGAERLRAANMRVVEVASEVELISWLDANQVDVYVSDMLDTEPALMREVRARVGRLVSFEDMGEGAREADAVVNAIYEGASPHSNTYTGKRYVCLRDEFLSTAPASAADEVSRVLVTFGGTDPLDLTSRAYRIASRWREQGPGPDFEFVLGPGYSGSGIEDLPELGIHVHRDVVRMSDVMRRCQMAVSSQGRTTFELAAMGVPTVVLAQNERERLHTFAQMDNGFINLGLGSDVSDEDIESALRWLAGAKSVRREMRNRMLANDLRSGMARVKGILLGEAL